MREVEDIDLKNEIVTAQPRDSGRGRLELYRYDYLVIALGGVTNFYGMPGLLEHAPCPFAHPGRRHRACANHLIHALEEADVETDPELRRKLLTFVVAGGGFSGVEAMAEINDFVRAVKRHYINLKNEPVRCVLIHSRDRILQEMTEKLALFAQKILTKRGVEIILKDRLSAATSEKAILKSGVEIPCKTLVSTVPSIVAPVLQRSSIAPKQDGRLKVNASLELEGYEGQVWALGDCAFIKTAPPTAQHATREAKTVAQNIIAALRGGAKSEFAFEGLGTPRIRSATTPRSPIFWAMRVSGLLAWFLWRGIYFFAKQCRELIANSGSLSTGCWRCSFRRILCRSRCCTNPASPASILRPAKSFSTKATSAITCMSLKKELAKCCAAHPIWPISAPAITSVRWRCWPTSAATRPSAPPAH